ncbi:MAG: class I SAM-dependent methyltransferase [Bacteroidetes bacterium]|nr:class I SAM-dependent methyltransferase [Bacteroidota bacterium]
MWHIYRILIKLFGKKKVLDWFNRRSYRKRIAASKAHQLQMELEFGFHPQPEWTNHYFDSVYQWRETRIPYWVERGVFSLLAMEQNCNVLELCSGDGFNSYHFYSIRASQVTSVDFDPNAIHHAKKYNQAPNVTFQLADIRTEMPVGTFDNVVWDAAIEHFTPEEIHSILSGIKSRLKPGGVLSGYTLKEEAPEKKAHHLHEYEFKSPDDLKNFFTPYFKHVTVFETLYPTRHNLYFYASDGEIPFGKNWKHAVHAE